MKLKLELKTLKIHRKFEEYVPEDQIRHIADVIYELSKGMPDKINLSIELTPEGVEIWAKPSP